MTKATNNFFLVQVASGGFNAPRSLHLFVYLECFIPGDGDFGGRSAVDFMEFERFGLEARFRRIVVLLKE